MQQWIYWAGILFYSATVLAVGWRGLGKAQTTSSTDYWSAGKNLGPWATGLSISASFMSISWSCVYAVQLVYWYGLSAVWLLAVPWLIVMVFFYFLTPHFRKLPAFSQPEMLGHKFGEDIRRYFALPLAFVFLVWGGAEIYAAAQILSPILKAPFHLILALIALVVAGYSYMGGFSAVVTTDKVQFALVAFFVTAISWVATDAVLEQAPISEALQTLAAPPKTGQPAFSPFAAGWVLVTLTLFAYLPGWIVETDIWLRLQAARSEKAARQGVLIAAANSVLFIVLTPLIIGLAALWLYPPVGAEIPAILNDGAAIFAVLINEHTPKLLGLLLTVGLAAAAMSTIDTCSNVMAVSLSYDLLEPYLLKKNKDADLRKVARSMSALAVGMAYVYALFTDSLWDIFYLSSGVLTTTLFIPMMALFRKNTPAKKVRNSAVTGFVATIVLYFLESHGVLAGLQPEWLQQTGLGYIIWAFILSYLAFRVS